MTIPMFNIAPQLAVTESAWTANLEAMFQRGQFICGEQMQSFEREFARAMGANTVVGVGSGTSAIELCLRAAGLGGSGREVIVPALTSLFTAQAIVAAGCVPVIADVDPRTLLLDVAEVERLIGKKTGAILPVHLYGHACDLPAIGKLARQAHVAIVQDACQAHGLRCNGRPLAAYSPYVAYSFYPTKNLGALGDGGAVATNRGHAAAKLLLLRDGGRHNDQISRITAVNSRLDEMQCCYLRAFLPQLADWTARRRRLSALYDELLGRCAGIRPVPRGQGSVDHLYVVRTSQQEHLREYLAGHGIMTAVHYPVPLHRQPAFHTAAKLPHAEKACREIVSLPLWPYLEEDCVRLVAARIMEFGGTTD